MKIFLLVIILLYSNIVNACFPAKISLKDRISNTTNIAVGYVTGKYLTEFEKGITDTNLSVTLNQSYQLRVKITQNLKGKFKSIIINPIISNCGSGGAELAQKVVVFYVDDYWYVEPLDPLKFELLNSELNPKK
jgi:hypothetical protein